MHISCICFAGQKSTIDISKYEVIYWANNIFMEDFIDENFMNSAKLPGLVLGHWIDNLVAQVGNGHPQDKFEHCITLVSHIVDIVLASGINLYLINDLQTQTSKSDPCCCSPSSQLKAL